MCQCMLHADIWFQRVHVPFLIKRFLSTVQVLYFIDCFLKLCGNEEENQFCMWEKSD